MAEFESVVDYSTKLENFDGPLDLLLHLIKEAKIEIKDIFVSEVTDQYLQYISNLNEIDVEKASEYLIMAATLLEIKSKAVLPKVEEYLDEIEDPEQALIRQIEEYKLFKEAGEKLKQQETTARFYKPPEKSAGEVKIVYTDFNLDGLISAFSKLLLKVDERSRAKDEHKEIPKDVFTVADKIDFIRDTLLARESVSFFELFSSHCTRNELITTFQAMLELLKHQFIRVEQNDTFDDITIILREDRSDEIGEIDEYN